MRQIKSMLSISLMVFVLSGVSFGSALAETKSKAAPAAAPASRFGSDPKKTAQSLKTIAALSKSGALKSLAKTAGKGGTMPALNKAKAAPATKTATVSKDKKNRY